MDIKITASPNEMTDLVSQLQGRQDLKYNSTEVICEAILRIMDYMASSRLDDVPTKRLVEELSKREGVEQVIAEPYKDAQVRVNGPAIILTVID